MTLEAESDRELIARVRRDYYHDLEADLGSGDDSWLVRTLASRLEGTLTDAADLRAALVEIARLLPRRNPTFADVMATHSVLAQALGHSRPLQ